MGYMETFELLCDSGEDCDEGESIGSWSTVGVARSVAVKRGWACDDTGDWCPEHKHENER